MYIFNLIFLLFFINLPEINSSCAWDNCPNFINDGKTVNVHIVAHTHDDMGWIKTADDYFTGYNIKLVNRAVGVIIDTVVTSLKRNSERKFSYAEVGFLTRWLETRSKEEVQDLINLVNNGQLELIGGGWVQPDEAATNYIELIDMYTLGLRRLNHTFGDSCTKLKTGWQIDPFGHSKEHANLLSLMGYESVYFAREHHLEHDLRKKEKRLEFQWYTSYDYPSRKILGGAFFQHYNQPSGFCFDWSCGDHPVVIHPEFENYNADEIIRNIRNFIENQALPALPHKHVLLMMGDDFQYENAEQNFLNLDNFIWLINNRTEYKAFYSNPSCYTQAIKGANINWTNKTYDFFPYGSDPNAYWTGYFTSKPTLKGLIRLSSNYLNTINILNSLSLQENETEYSTGIEKLERALGLSLHHDAITGTSKEKVTQDYDYRIFQGINAIQDVYHRSLQTISQKNKNNSVKFPQQYLCLQLNETACNFTQNINQNEKYSIILVNGHSRDTKQLIKIPINTKTVKLFDENNSIVDTAIITSTFINGKQINNSNILPFQLEFVANIPANGFTTYFVENQMNKMNANVAYVEPNKIYPKMNKDNLLTNGIITVNFDDNNLIKSIKMNNDNKEYQLKQTFLYYDGHDNSGRASGAYVFRPELNVANYVTTDKPSLEIVNNTEARQIFTDWVSQTIRLHPENDFVEFEWTVGPLPFNKLNDKKYGKELITRYETNINSSDVFYTDSNGRQLIKRQRNFNPDYKHELTEPVASNYYPVNTKVVIKDDKNAMAVLTDRSQAVGSILDNSIEFLIHRRDYYDDGFGVNEALNEPGRDGRGLVVRGVHRIYFSDPNSIASKYREGTYELYNSPFVSFSSIDTIEQYKEYFTTSYSGLQQNLPLNIRLLSFKKLYSNNLLLRLEHIYQKNEDDVLSKSVTIDLNQIFKDLKINFVQEMSLGANEYINNSSTTIITMNPQDIKTFQINVL